MSSPPMGSAGQERRRFEAFAGAPSSFGGSARASSDEFELPFPTQAAPASAWLSPFMAMQRDQLGLSPLPSQTASEPLPPLPRGLELLRSVTPGPAHAVPPRVHLVWLGGPLKPEDAVIAGHFGARGDVLLTVDRPVATLKAGLSLHSPLGDVGRLRLSRPAGLGDRTHDRPLAGSLDSSTLRMDVVAEGQLPPDGTRGLRVQQRAAAFAAIHDPAVPEDLRAEFRALDLMASLESVGHANLGAASDLTRVALLQHKGGLYLDLDAAGEWMSLWNEDPSHGGFLPLSGPVQAPLGHLNRGLCHARLSHNNDVIAAAAPEPGQSNSMREYGRRMLLTQAEMARRPAWQVPDRFLPLGSIQRQADFDHALEVQTDMFRTVQVPPGPVEFAPGDLLSGRGAPTLADQRRFPPEAKFSLKFTGTMVTTGPLALQETNTALVRDLPEARSHAEGQRRFTSEVFTDLRALRAHLNVSPDNERVPGRHDWLQERPTRAYEAPF